MNTALISDRHGNGIDFDRIQAHYDVGDDFYALFLDESMTYSCGKFDSPETTLAEAQRAKIDLSLGKCELRPGMTLLDIGCGWGATAFRAAERYGAKVTGLTLSQNQYAYAQRRAAGHDDIEFRLEGWETFDGHADRIISIGAFEHFGHAKYGAFFEKCRQILPDDGVMLLHSITWGRPSADEEFFGFIMFLATEIFPGGELPEPEAIVEQARHHGFELVHAESLRPHYARTLDCWTANLETHRDMAVGLVGAERYDMYIRYLTGAAARFRSGEVDVYQFKLRVA